MNNIAFYGSHNASVAIEKDGKIELVIELERLLNFKNSGLAQYKCPRGEDILFLNEFLRDIITAFIGVEEFDNCYFLNTDVYIDGKRYALETTIKAKKYTHMLHHQAHAAGAFYQSTFKKALVFSFDGGGNDGFFNVYKADRKNSVELLEAVLQPSSNSPHSYYDLGFPYMIFGHYLKDIRQEQVSDGNLVYSGKLMGLASYGEVRQEWLHPFTEFYKSRPDGLNYEELVSTLGSKIGIKLDHQEENRLEGKVGWDIAATSQRVFEECFLEVALPYLKQFPKHPVVLAGGCGLNIILNTRLVQEFNRKVFVGPNPNDCGLSVGMLLHNMRPTKSVDVTYLGLPLLDINTVGTFMQNSHIAFKTEKMNLNRVSEDLKEGRIVGIARGRAEHGPRALGNRSILCNPTLPDMKDILNQKVKNREWYRPFAPVVRLEDVSEYFEWEEESRWMSFCPKVKKEWIDVLQSITHVDGTARVQTVTRDQNEWLYDLLTIFKEDTGVGVLLNTSFNVAGKPILSTVKDAFTLFETTYMDSLLVENYYLRKNYRNE